MKGFVMLIMVLIVAFGLPGAAHAHESQPGTLELRQVDKDRYEVTWRAPIYFGRPHPARPELPEDWKTMMEPTMRMLSDSQVFRLVVTVGKRGRKPVQRVASGGLVPCVDCA